jgi:AcrR family transcriptional regulator
VSRAAPQAYIARMSTSPEPPPWTGDPLPRGRHKLPRETVRASQRARLLRAMEELVGERGYEATSVPQVIAAARVSSNTFYGLFTDKADCFIALCELHGDQLFAALTAPPAQASDATDALAALDRGIAAYLQWWADRPAMARAYFVELPAVGPRALQERERQYERFAALHRTIAERARAVYPEAPPLRDAEVTAAVILTTELVARQIRSGRLDQVEELGPDLRHLLLKLLVGEAAADYAAAHAPEDRQTAP